MEVPLPWERLLWASRPWWLPGVRYALTDFRVVRSQRGRIQEIALHDIGEVRSTRSLFERLTGTCSLVISPRDAHRPPLVLRHVRGGSQLAALLELAAGVPQLSLDPEVVSALLTWRPAWGRPGIPGPLVALAPALIVVFGVAIATSGQSSPIVYAADDAIYPGGRKLDREAIVRFMETEVMPWARVALAPLKGGAAQVTCETCHGRDAASRDWRMPAVAALPEPDVKLLGLETYHTGADAQVRNAIYGYRAQHDNQAKAAYMREVIMPGMARLLHRSAYDFTKSYEFNRTRRAFGCYHCHKVG
jgi:hypothetical protein